MEEEFSESYETRYNFARERIATAIANGNKSINLSGLGLKSIPEELYDVENLKELYLGKNQLSELPPRFSELKELKSLSLQRCQFVKFPEVILELKQLQSLNLSRNKIEAIPDSINLLTEIKELTLAKNRINYIPNTIGELNKLSTIELRGNLISKIPTEMSNLRNLTKITLIGNPINFPHGKTLKGILPGQNALFQILHHFVNEGAYTKKESANTVTSTIELPEALRTAFQQYLIFFNDFVEKAKAVKINIQVNQYSNGIELTYSETIDNSKIIEYLDEYIGFIRQEVENISPKFEKGISKYKQDILIVELKNQLRHLTGQLEIKRIENSLLQKQVDMFHQLLIIGAQNPQPIQINALAESFSTSTSTSNVSIDFKLEIQNLQNEFLRFKNEVHERLNDGQLEELEIIDKSLLEVDENAESPEKVDKSHFKRLKRIIEQINEPGSDWNKAITATKKGIDLFQKIGKQYNKIAPWLAIPSIPEQLL